MHSLCKHVCMYVGRNNEARTFVHMYIHTYVHSDTVQHALCSRCVCSADLLGCRLEDAKHVYYAHLMLFDFVYTYCICAVYQTINFTLQSSLHGIDFGLVQNGVIFYDCLVSER